MTMATGNPEQEEIVIHAVTIPERLSVIEANQNSLIGEMRENARRHDQNYRELDAKFDKLLFTIIGIGGGVIITLISGIITMVITR